MLRFFDDITFCAETKKHLQNILLKVNKILWNEYGMQLNKKRKNQIYGVQENKSST